MAASDKAGVSRIWNVRCRTRSQVRTKTAVQLAKTLSSERFTCWTTELLCTHVPDPSFTCCLFTHTAASSEKCSITINLRLSLTISLRLSLTIDLRLSSISRPQLTSPQLSLDLITSRMTG